MAYVGVATKLTTSNTTTVYTAPSGVSAIVNLISIANISPTNVETVEVSIRKNGDANDVYINKGESIISASTLQISGPYVINAGDSLKIKSGSANTLDVVLAIMETT